MVFNVSKDICDGPTYRLTPFQFVAVAFVFRNDKYPGKMFKSDVVHRV